MLTLYSLTGCPMCDHAKSVLAEKKIDYVLSMDKEEMLKLGITHCPALKTEDGNILSGKALILYINSLGGK